MISKRMNAALIALLLLPCLAFSYPRVPPGVKVNPPGLARPKHLGKEWPKLNIDQKLYSLRFESMRKGYEELSEEHHVPRTSPLPLLREQFGLMAYKNLPPDYYGKHPPIIYEQPYEDRSACLIGCTGLIDIPSAYTQKRGTWIGSLFIDSVTAGEKYFPVIYDDIQANDIVLAATYGYRDNAEFTLKVNAFNRDIEYDNGADYSTNGKFLVGMGFKLSFPTFDDGFQIAAGGMFTLYDNKDRNVIRIKDYDSLAALFMVASTDSRLWNAHVMLKHVMYDYNAENPPTGQLGNDPTTGYGLSDSQWDVLGIGIEYKVNRRLRFINEFTNTGGIDFISRKDSSWNFAVQNQMSKTDLKLYLRMPNHKDYNQVGLIASFQF